MICLHTKLHMPRTNGSLVITIKLETNTETSCSCHVVVFVYKK